MSEKPELECRVPSIVVGGTGPNLKIKVRIKYIFPKDGFCHCR